MKCQTTIELSRRCHEWVKILCDEEQTLPFAASPTLVRFELLALLRAPDGRLLYVSLSSERVTGYQPQEFIENLSLLFSTVHHDDALVLPQPRSYRGPIYLRVFQTFVPSVMRH